MSLFRGICFPPKEICSWLKVIALNRGSIFRIVNEPFSGRTAQTPDATGRRDR